MNDKVKATETQETVESTKIRPDLEKYTKARSASGSITHHNGDAVASALEGLTVDEVASLAVKATGDEELLTRYSHLNIGQQRMNLGNRIRGAIARRNKENEKAVQIAIAEGKDAPELESGEDKLASLAAPFRKKADERAAKAKAEAEAKAEAKAKADAEKAAKAEKADKATAKAEAKS